VAVPHCQADGLGQPDARSISLTSVHAKQEALQLHNLLERASMAAAAGDHAAVLAELAPVLLCCTDKEQQMLQLDQQQWLRGMQMLLSAASAASSWLLALRCHLRLLHVLLPAVPPQLAGFLRGGEEEIAADGAAAALHAAAEQVMAQPLLAGSLDVAARFLQQHRAALAECVPDSSHGGCGSDDIGGSCEQQHVHALLQLHSMERAVYEALQQQLSLAVAACTSSLAAAGGPAADSCLNLQVCCELDLPHCFILSRIMYCSPSGWCIHFPPLLKRPSCCRPMPCALPCVMQPPCCYTSPAWPLRAGCKPGRGQGQRHQLHSWWLWSKPRT